MKRLTKAEILAKKQRKTHEFEVPEWDGSLVIRSLKADEVLRLRKYMEDGKPTSDDYFYELIKSSLLDEYMQPSFTVEDLKEIFDQNTLNQILIEISALNGLNEDAVKQAKEELKKATDSSTSGSL